MKYIFLTFALTATFAINVSSQTGPAESEPVLQSSMTYKMPQSAIDAEIDGKVVITMQIDKTGKPTKANVVSGPIWPCSATPTKVLEDLFKHLSEEMLKLQFTPAIEKGKPVGKEVGLSFTLKNPKLESKPVVDPDLGKANPKIVKGGVLNGKAISLPPPVYPAEAKAIRAGGAVPVEVMFDETGKVIRAGANGGHPKLQFAARYAACGAKFAPVKLSGIPVKVSGVITYNFVP